MKAMIVPLDEISIQRTLLVSRHAAAQRWLLIEAEKRGWKNVVKMPHCKPEQVKSGDRVVGTLPIQLAAEICARNAEYWHLEIVVEEIDRGRELDFNELVKRGPLIQRYRIEQWEDEA
jgi:CRISPR-associated protein Csx16